MKAMILAAGRGERMRPLTDTCPKPLLKAGGKPLLQWHIEALVQAGISQIVINHAHLGGQIENFFGDGATLGAQIAYSPESTALETAGGISNAMHLLGSDPFIVINGDVACNWQMEQAQTLAKNWPEGQLAYLVMVPNPTHNPKGDFSLSGVEVALPSPGSEALTFSGIGIYHPALFSTVKPGQVAKLAPLLREAMAAGKVRGELHTGFWMDIGTPERLQELDQRLNSGRTHSA